MHEHDVVADLVEMLVEECQERSFETIHRVTTELGELTTFEEYPIQFYFDILKKDHPPLKESELIVNKVRGKVFCRTCGKENDIDDPAIMLCPECYSSDIEVIAGKDFIIKEIEV